jgi:hypothetical protein
MAIDESYVSPMLRWGLLLNDHPGAKSEFKIVSVEQLPIPERFREDKEYLVCSIVFPDGNATAIGWKPLKAAKKPGDEGYAALRTMALGRALKDAGYPDKMPDLKALVLWRQRQAEISAIQSGVPRPALPVAAESIERALEEAADPVADATSPDDGSPDIVDAEVVEEDTDPPEIYQQILQGAFSAEADATDEGPTPDKKADIFAALEGFGNKDRAIFRGYLRDLKVTEDPDTWSDEVLDDLHSWILEGR